MYRCNKCLKTFKLSKKNPPKNINGNLYCLDCYNLIKKGDEE